jgi:hypothetical protein
VVLCGGIGVSRLELQRLQGTLPNSRLPPPTPPTNGARGFPPAERLFHLVGTAYLALHDLNVHVQHVRGAGAKPAHEVLQKAKFKNYLPSCRSRGELPYSKTCSS